MTCPLLCPSALLQALVRLVWCLGKLGYRPAGGALTGWLAARLAGSGSSSSAGVPLSSYSAGQLALLLSGLRGCRVVLGGRWLAQLLAHSTAHAQQMPLEVGGLNWLLLLRLPGWQPGALQHCILQPPA